MPKTLKDIIKDRAGRKLTGEEEKNLGTMTVHDTDMKPKEEIVPGSIKQNKLMTHAPKVSEDAEPEGEQIDEGTSKDPARYVAHAAAAGNPKYKVISQGKTHFLQPPAEVKGSEIQVKHKNNEYHVQSASGTKTFTRHDDALWHIKSKMSKGEHGVKEETDPVVEETEVLDEAAGHKVNRDYAKKAHGHVMRMAALLSSDSMDHHHDMKHISRQVEDMKDHLEAHDAAHKDMMKARVRMHKDALVGKYSGGLFH